ncbi:MAG: DNA recombination protein RmuC [Gammaproteobacteria bacterium]|nr:DNA recombination protein RmuC [Gammaproteobacteria bacterium]
MSDPVITIELSGQLITFTKEALILATISTLLGGLLGWLLTLLYQQKRITQMQTRLRMEHAATQRALEDTEQRFANLSTEALQKNHQAFINLAMENLGKFQRGAEASLQQREQSMQNMVKPIHEALEKSERQAQLMEKARHEAYGALTQQIESLVETQKHLQGETRNLVQALRRPEVRGQWGEITLKRLVELAGMVEHCDFFEQEHTPTGEAAIRPDMIVRMPGNREVVVDVKTPLDAYLSAVEATDEKQRSEFLRRHMLNVRERVRELSAKAYWGQFSNAPDFVILFIPGDQFLTAALDQDPGLLESAMSKKVILSTPTSLMALLRAIAYGWRQELLTENAEKIRGLGEEMYHRLAVFSEHLSKVGRSLDSSVTHYNKAVGSFQSKLIPGAVKFTEMGIKPRKEIEAPEQTEKSARQVEQTTSKDEG